MSFIALALLGAAITVVPTSADQLNKVIVKYYDLDIATADGREALDQRLRRAVRIACGDSKGESAMMKLAIGNCVRDVSKKVAHQRDLAIAKSEAKLAGGF